MSQYCPYWLNLEQHAVFEPSVYSSEAAGFPRVSVHESFITYELCIKKKNFKVCCFYF